MNMNYGCGSVQIPGWVNVDRDDYGQEFRLDLLQGLPFHDDYYELIVASHSLQELPHDDLLPAFRELHRVIAPGGCLRAIVPDVAAAFEAYRDGEIDFFPINDNEPSLDDKMCCYINWFGSARSLFTERRMVDTCLRAGFSAASRVQFGVGAGGEHDNREPERCLIVMATK